MESRANNANVSKEATKETPCSRMPIEVETDIIPLFVAGAMLRDHLLNNNRPTNKEE